MFFLFSFCAHVKQQHPKNLVSLDEFLRLRKEIAKPTVEGHQLRPPGEDEELKGEEDGPPGVEDSPPPGETEEKSNKPSGMVSCCTENKNTGVVFSHMDKDWTKIT